MPIRGNFDDALDVVRELGERGGVAVVNSINPFRIEGQKTAAFEICDALGDAPDVHCIPVGQRRQHHRVLEGLRRVRRATARDDARRACSAGRPRDRRRSCIGEPVPHPETIATAIRIGNPASWDGAIAARDESGGAIGAVTDAEILDAYRLLAATEGVFVEPASAASVAGLLQAATRGLGRARRDGRVHGDRPRAEGPEPGDRARSKPRPAVDATVDAVLEELGL